MSQETSDSLSLTPGKALGKRKSTPSSRYGEGSPYLDSEGWAGGRAASAGGSGRMSNPIALDMSGSGLDVSGSSSVLLEGVVAGAHEGEDEVGEGDEEEAGEESSDSGDSVKEVKTRGKSGPLIRVSSSLGRTSFRGRLGARRVVPGADLRDCSGSKYQRDTSVLTSRRVGRTG